MGFSVTNLRFLSNCKQISIFGGKINTLATTWEGIGLEIPCSQENANQKVSYLNTIWSQCVLISEFLQYYMQP